MSKTVVVIAYHFPPGGGPGVQRVLKHVTYLREFGWTSDRADRSRMGIFPPVMSLSWTRFLPTSA